MSLQEPKHVIASAFIEELTQGLAEVKAAEEPKPWFLIERILIAESKGQSGLAPRSEIPEGWTPWAIGQPAWNQESRVAAEEALKALPVKRKTTRTKASDHPNLFPGDPALGEADLKVTKKVKAPKLPMDLRSVFDRKLAALDRSTLHRPWMATKVLKQIETVSQLQAWAKRVVADRSAYGTVARTGESMPVIAVDTETYGLYETSGLDTRLVNGKPQIGIAGICLCANGIEALYVPLNHEDGKNLPMADVVAILQELFDQSLLVFYNAKFDREVLRITMGLRLREYPYFEDVQIDHYLLDPKSDADLDGSTFEASGLKKLSEIELGINQIELKELSVVKAKKFNTALGKETTKNQYAPFIWIPTDLATLYAAADALCTWLLWFKLHAGARAIRFPHLLDHELVDGLTWIERQRFHMDVAYLTMIRKWHAQKVLSLKKDLATLVDNPDFNPGSTKQLGPILFDHYQFPVIKKSEAGTPSTDEDTINELLKLHKDHPFLTKLLEFRTYAALHPENLRYDDRDGTARLFFKQNTVAGGRLAAMGGEYEKDGGFGLNPQAVKSVGGNQWIKAWPLVNVPEGFNPLEVAPLTDAQLDPSCFNKGKLAAQGLLNNAVARYFDSWYFLGSDRRCLLQDGTEIELGPKQIKVDANEVLNLRALFIAQEGWTFFTTDYANIEMRVAANVSRETAFINEFLHGSGDFHTLTAKAVFPEFSDPTVDPVKKKALRGIAKIINFALLYGGTEHTIYENLKVEDPTMTRERAKSMVDKYWAAVPKFQAWALGQQARAKDTLTCKTPSGRIIDFRSAMKTMRIEIPAEGTWEKARTYWNLKRKAEEAKDNGLSEEAAKLWAKAEALRVDRSAGVAASVSNYQEYNRFLGKIQRVAVNAPLQGLAGDLMRKAISEVRRTVYRFNIQPVIQVHATVHDELDKSIKDEWAPFVLPRISRAMKLREMHEHLKWPVPIETDCEYGRSWDVKHHLTGDDTHAPAGWTLIEGMERYYPKHLWASDEIESMVATVRTLDQERIKALIEELTPRLHSRVHASLPLIGAAPSPDEAERRLYAYIQLDEFWKIDGTPSDQDTDTAQAYAERNGLPFWGDLADDGLMPIGNGSAGTLEAPEDPTPTAVVHDAPEPLDRPEPEAVEPDLHGGSGGDAGGLEEGASVSPEVEEAQVVAHDPGPPPENAIAILRPELTAEDLDAFRKSLGIGKNTLKVIWNGDTIKIVRISKTQPPAIYVAGWHTEPVDA